MKQSVKKKQVALTLEGRPLELFLQFKLSMGFNSDAEAARVLMAARLHQLKRQGHLAKAA